MNLSDHQSVEQIVGGAESFDDIYVSLKLKNSVDEKPKRLKINIDENENKSPKMIKLLPIKEDISTPSNYPPKT